ncbi:ATP-binding cassette domain-containing protein [Sneathiella sp. P13V-1]|uniref:ATP-binding cassette domain-containing protein n=1 Tax=Sneathiella sp. P13V-1 TaxID=2697366 RepID=UPI00187B5774|nr:ATP-binding cassette domain-containing protein [Sneathiella sp. P13V-1]MBE7637260.1 ATP-binding cassette domain-containing protein [Sneathiella sp. P13V-1]
MPYPLLHLKNLSKRFGGVIAIDDMEMSIEAGTLSAIIGPNGCGKSTLFNVICGAESADSGSVIFDQVDISNKKAEEICKLGIGRKFQSPSVFEEMTVAENIALPLIRFGVATPQNISAEDILTKVGLIHKKEVLAGSLSHGEKQWLEISMVLIQSPKLILLDEPTAGMTVGETQETVRLIKELNQTLQTTIIVIEHDIRFIQALDCPIYVLSAGHIVMKGSFEEVSSNPDVRALYFGKREMSFA